MNFLNRTSTKIAIGIILITTIILTFLTVFSIATAQSEFQRATIQVAGDNGFFVQSLPDPFEIVRMEFNRKLMTNLAFAGILGIVLAIGAGFIFSTLITQPLRELQNGIRDLKKNKYKTRLELTGETEFDEVIEEFNEVAAELEYQEELRNNLISDVSHELKTPVTSLSAQLEGIKDKVLKLDKKRLELLQHDTKRLNELIDLLNEDTKLRAKTKSLKREEFELKDFVDFIVDINKQKLEQEKIKISNKITSSVVIRADKSMLERIFQNIIDNAIRYSGTKEIKVEFKTNTISISDKGTGIPKNDLKKIFERFYRVEKSRSRKTGGLGLGLALVKQMVESHDWQIEAVQNKPHGLKFNIYLN